jgi:hypothetical protein
MEDPPGQERELEQKEPVESAEPVEQVKSEFVPIELVNSMINNMCSCMQKNYDKMREAFVQGVIYDIADGFTDTTDKEVYEQFMEYKFVKNNLPLFAELDFATFKKIYENSAEREGWRGN